MQVTDSMFMGKMTGIMSSVNQIIVRHEWDLSAVKKLCLSGIGDILRGKN